MSTMTIEDVLDCFAEEASEYGEDKTEALGRALLALAAHDREVAAQALEAFAETWAEQDGIEALMFARDDVSAVQLTEKAILARVADLRSGTEGSTN